MIMENLIINKEIDEMVFLNKKEKILEKFVLQPQLV